MNFYHFKPCCKVIKRSRYIKNPILSNHDEEVVTEVYRFEKMVIQNGKLDLFHFGVFHEYSRKVFVGGLPRNTNEASILERFNKFGSLVVDWPYKESTTNFVPPKGFVFLIFEKNASVDYLLYNCQKRNGDEYFTNYSTKKEKKSKWVQAIPWKLSGADHFFAPLSQINPRLAVFVGGVPRTLNAEQIGTIMLKLFGGVAYVGIDVDPLYSYPKGSARVIFLSKDSVVRAIKKRFVMPRESNNRKMMEIKPYILDDQICDRCQMPSRAGKSTLFCAEPQCLTYLCEFCWIEVHSQLDFQSITPHVPVVKQGADDYVNAVRNRRFRNE